MKILSLLLTSFIGLYACGLSKDSAGTQPAKTADSAVPVASNSPTVPVASPAVVAESADGPKTVRDFFSLLPDKYFVLEACERDKDKDCTKARAEYLKTFTEVEDIKNGYFKGGCDGAQSCIEMAIFKRPDGNYLVAIATSSEMINDFYFLDYTGGKWTDVSRDVPTFSKSNWYELPRVGTTVKVFEKKVTEKGDDYEISEKGKKLYDLVWKDGRFTKE